MKRWPLAISIRNCHPRSAGARESAIRFSPRARRGRVSQDHDIAADLRFELRWSASDTSLPSCRRPGGRRISSSSIWLVSKTVTPSCSLIPGYTARVRACAGIEARGRFVHEKNRCLCSSPWRSRHAVASRRKALRQIAAAVAQAKRRRLFDRSRNVAPDMPCRCPVAEILFHCELLVRLWTGIRRRSGGGRLRVPRPTSWPQMVVLALSRPPSAWKECGTVWTSATVGSEETGRSRPRLRKSSRPDSATRWPYRCVRFSTRRSQAGPVK